MTIDETTNKLEEQLKKMDVFLSVVSEANKTVTPQVIKEFLNLVLSVISNTKKDFENLSSSQLDELKNALKYITDQYEEQFTKLAEKGTNSIKEINTSIKEAKIILDDIIQQRIKADEEAKGYLEEMKSSNEGILETVTKQVEDLKVLIPSPYILDPLKIRDELLTLKGDDRLDISAIKGFEEWIAKIPKGKGKNEIQYFQGGSGYVKSIIAGTGVTISVDANNNVTVNATGGAGSGDVTGGASSTANAIARYNGTTGKIIKNTGVTIDDSDNISGVGLNLSSLTASTILITDSSKNIVSAATATYPSLTELSYVKGVTSEIQTQINAKGAGTVTSVAWTTSQGVSASVANSTTTPNITITLGALTGVTSFNGLVITANTGTITTGVWNGTTIAVANGGTGVTSVTTTPTASAFAGWDANVNLSSNSFIASRTSTATAGGTTTLTVTSTQIQIFTGSSSQTCKLPVVTTLSNGQTFRIINNSSAGTIAVQSSGANLLLTLAIGTEGIFTVVDTTGGTGTASWDWKTTGFTNYTGTGGIVVLSVSPSFTTPSLGTPSSGTLTNCTGLPIAGLVASTSTAIGVGSVELGHATDTTIARVSAGVVSIEGVNILMNGGALGTPSSGTLTNCTGLPIAGLTASTSTAIGVGSIELGHATDTTISRSSAGVIAVEGVVIPSISSTNTLTNKRITKRVYTATNNASLTPEIDTYDIFHLTAMSANTTINNHSTSTPTDGELMTFRFLDNATPRTLTFGSAYVAKGGIALPTTTTTSKNLTVMFEYNSNLAKWNLLASALEA